MVPRLEEGTTTIGIHLTNSRPRRRCPTASDAGCLFPAPRRAPYAQDRGRTCTGPGNTGSGVPLEKVLQDWEDELLSADYVPPAANWYDVMMNGCT